MAFIWQISKGHGNWEDESNRLHWSGVSVPITDKIYSRKPWIILVQNVFVESHNSWLILNCMLCGVSVYGHVLFALGRENTRGILWLWSRCQVFQGMAKSYHLQTTLGFRVRRTDEEQQQISETRIAFVCTLLRCDPFTLKLVVSRHLVGHFVTPSDASFTNMD